MRTTTAADLILRARYLADNETSTGSTDFVTDTEALAYVTSEYRELIDLIVDSGGLDQLLTSAVLTTPYALPADFYRAASLDQADGSLWSELERFNFRERNRFCDTSRPRWRIISGAIVFEPVASAPSSVKLWYVADMAALTSTSTSLNAFNGWDDYVVAGVAVRMLAKEERDPTMAQTLKAAAGARIRKICSDLVVVDTETVADVERVSEDYFDLWSYA